MRQTDNIPDEKRQNERRKKQKITHWIGDVVDWDVMHDLGVSRTWETIFKKKFFVLRKWTIQPQIEYILINDRPDQAMDSRYY